MHARGLRYDRWLLKADGAHGGRGTAVFEAGALKAVHALRARRAEREAAGETGYWGAPTTQHEARAALLPVLRKALPRRVVFAVPGAHADWPDFLSAFTRVGGVVEAVPGAVLGHPTVNIFVAPSGEVSVCSAVDSLLAAPFVYGGASFPQTCVPHAAVAGAALAVGRVLSDQGVLGCARARARARAGRGGCWIHAAAAARWRLRRYASIDFVAFRDDASRASRLWAVDLDLRPSAPAASFSLFHFLLGGRYSAATGEYAAPLALLPPPPASPGKGGAPPAGVEPPRPELAPRSFVSVEYLAHPALAPLQVCARPMRLMHIRMRAPCD